MTTLLMLRHAEASASAARDHERPLTNEGRRNAALAGRALAAVGAPDRALVSSAMRARETVALASEHGGWDADVVALDELYGADVGDVFTALAAQAKGSETLLVVGHEPWCSAVIEALTGARLRMAAASLACLQVGPAWDALDPEWCALVWFAPPWAMAALAEHR
jgi:phosphohistidine phosphatase